MNEESLFHLALDKPLHERAAFLDSACGGNAELRQRVERLLQAHDNPGSFLQEPVLGSIGSSPSAATQALEPAAAKPVEGARTHTEMSHPAPEDLTFLVPSTRPDALGRLEHYHVLEVIGKGGFGTVLRAFDEKLHRVVAIKVLAPELAASGTARQRFIREARTAAAVTHEHVVTIHAVVEEHRPPYLVMQMIDGVTLQDKLDRVGMLSLREILRIGMQMAEGLAAAHKQGLVHRDIKPANILLENGVERVKITDFGLAKVADDASVTQSGVVAGTPMYMSPEQANGEPLDHRSDLFSLGTVLYVMCTGRPPFRASGTMGVLKRVIEDSPRPIREINPDIPDWLEDIINQLHAKKPEERYQTAKEVAELLGERLADVQAGRTIERTGSVPDRSEPTQAPVARASGSPSATGSPGRYWKIALVGILTAACVLVGISYLVGRWFQGELAFVNFDPGKAAVDVVLNLHHNGVNRIYPLTPGVHADVPAGDFHGEFNCRSGHQVDAIWVIEGTDKRRLQVAEKSFKLKLRKDQRVLLKFDTSVPRSRPILNAGWVHLFNGKDLTGWKTHPEQNSHWQIVDGALAATTPAGYLFTERAVGKNFHLRAEVLSGEKDFVGFYFRTNFDLQPRGKPLNQRTEEYYFPIRRTPESIELQDGPGQWRTVEIKVLDHWIEFSVDGKSVHTAYEEQLPSKTGYLALKASENVRVKSIALKELPPAPATGPEPGWVQLFNGKDLTSFIASDELLWSVAHGLLRSTSGGLKAELKVVPRTFENFHFRFEVKYDARAIHDIAFRSAEDGSCYSLHIVPGAKHLNLTSSSKDLRHLENAMMGDVPADRWLSGELIVKNKEVEVKVMDGTQIVAVRKYWVSTVQPGSIRFITQGGRVDYKKLEIKELSASSAPELGWVPLFNGNDLTDWLSRQPESWSVTAGVIQADVPGSAAQPVWLRYTPKLLGNFHLQAEVKVDKGYGTIHFRTQPEVPHHGYQLHPEGSLFSGVTQDYLVKGNVDYPRGRWFRIDIIADGNRIICKQDGKVIIDYTDPGWHLPVGRLWFQVNPGARILVRDIKVMELPTAEPGWVQLFNGKDLTGLEVNKANEGVWTVEKGVLTGTPKEKPPYYLYTQRADYQNYHLRLQAKLNPGGTSGVYLHLPKQGGGTWKGIALKLTHQDGDELSIDGYSLVLPRTTLSRGKRLLAPDHWFDLEIIKDGPGLEIKVDGMSVHRNHFAPEVVSRIDPRGAIALEVGDARSVLQVRSFEINSR